MLEELPIIFQGLGAPLPMALPPACSWQFTWSKPKICGSSLPFQWLKSPRGLGREKGVLQTLGQPRCFFPLPQGGSRRFQPRGRGVSSSVPFNLAILLGIQTGGDEAPLALWLQLPCLARQGRLVFPRGWLR